MSSKNTYNTFTINLDWQVDSERMVFTVLPSFHKVGENNKFVKVWWYGQPNAGYEDQPIVPSAWFDSEWLKENGIPEDMEGIYRIEHARLMWNKLMEGRRHFQEA